MENSERDRSLGLRTVEQLTEQDVVANPEGVANVIEFSLRNTKGQASPAEAIRPLYWLGANPEYRGRAVELLGIVAQSEDSEEAKAAETAIRSILRRKR